MARFWHTIAKSRNRSPQTAIVRQGLRFITTASHKGIYVDFKFRNFPARLCSQACKRPERLQQPTRVRWRSLRDDACLATLVKQHCGVAYVSFRPSDRGQGAAACSQPASCGGRCQPEQNHARGNPGGRNARRWPRIIAVVPFTAVRENGDRPGENDCVSLLYLVPMRIKMNRRGRSMPSFSAVLSFVAWLPLVRRIST